MSELLAQSVKVLAPANVLCQISLDMKIDGNDLLLKYSIELLKNSVSLTASDIKRFHLCIETARMAFQVSINWYLILCIMTLDSFKYCDLYYK